MNASPQSTAFYIGWDVGGWNCDKNAESRDAIVILDSSLTIVGTPWRGNLRTHINAASHSTSWIEALFALCGEVPPPGKTRITLAIDTPLGFSQAFMTLITGFKFAGPIESSATNPYLFRQTEHHLFEQGLRPLSAVKDMIGSQATKGMHALAKFAPKVVGCGVWTDGDGLTVIEAYPSPCKHSALMDDLLGPHADWRQVNHQDKVDALVCAQIAYCFDVRPESLSHPPDGVPAIEGWIWLPNDALTSNTARPFKPKN